MTSGLALRWASDRALLVELDAAGAATERIEETNRRVVAAWQRLRDGAPAWVRELQPAYTTLTITVDPLGTAAATIEQWVREALSAVTSTTAAKSAAEPTPWPVTTPVEIPTCYDPAVAPDLEEIARLQALAPQEVARRHAAAAYRVLFLGFTPGFGYLAGLPPELATPRLAAPRGRVEAGSVAIGGAQAGVYPLATPGGWRVIGRTPLRLFDPRREPMALLAPGDEVRFVPIDLPELARREGELAPREEPAGASATAATSRRGWLEVVTPGLLATVQDLGRPGYTHLGVSPCGAADTLSLRAGNLLLGNDPGAAALELTLVGGTFRISEERRCVLTGSDFGAMLEPSGVALRPWVPFALAPGQQLRLGATRTGARCYLCVAGGVDVAPLLGSRSTHLPSGLGGLDGRALRRGDRVPLGDDSGTTVPSAATERAVRAAATGALDQALRRRELRVTRGPQASWFAEGALAAAEYEVSERSDRLGLRLAGPPIGADEPRDLLTEGAPWGAVQVPPNGLPILLGVDQQTTGGYPKIAAVVAADLPTLGQLRPRDRVRFREVTLDEAHRLMRAQAAELTGDATELVEGG